MSVTLSRKEILVGGGEFLDGDIDELILDIRCQNEGEFTDALVGYSDYTHVCEDVPRLVRQHLWGVIEVTLIRRSDGATFSTDMAPTKDVAEKTGELAEYAMENEGMYKLGSLIGVAIPSFNGTSRLHGVLIIGLGSDSSEEVVDTEMFDEMAAKVGCLLDELGSCNG